MTLNELYNRLHGIMTITPAAADYKVEIRFIDQIKQIVPDHVEKTINFDVYDDGDDGPTDKELEEILGYNPNAIPQGLNK